MKNYTLKLIPIFVFALATLLSIDMVAQTATTTTSSPSPIMDIGGNNYQAYCVDYYDNQPYVGATYQFDYTPENVDDNVRACLEGMGSYGVSAVQNAIWYFTDGISPSGGSNAWTIINNVNNGSYTPHCATEWNPDDNSLQDMCVEFDQSCDNFAYECTDGVAVDVYGESENNKSASVFIPNSGNVFKTVVEIVYKGCDPGSSVQATINGGTVTIPEIVVMGGSSNVHVYRKTFDYSVSSASTYEECSGLQSILAFAFRNVANNGTVSGQYTAISGYCDDQNFTIPIIEDSSLRDITVTVPVSEVTNDGRHMRITATAGGQTAVEYINFPDNGCCLSVREVVITDVPGSATQVDININTEPNSDNFNPKNCGQSYVIAGIITAEVECNTVVCNGSITGVYIYDQATDAPVPGIPALFNGQNIDASLLPSNYYIVAETVGNIESVDISVDGLPQNCEDHEPYTFPNGAQDDDAGWNGGIGSYTVEADAYALEGCTGDLCDDVSLTFNIVQDCVDFSVDAGNDVTICEEEEVTLSAMVNGATECDCCVREVSNTNHCNNSNYYVLWLDGEHFTGNGDLVWEECGDGTARLTGTATKSGTTYHIDITYSGYSNTPPQGSPKDNNCGSTNASGWFYYTEMTGTLTNGSHVYTLTRRGPAFQVGNGANITATGYGGSGWFNATKNGNTIVGDINIMLSQNCSSSANCSSQTIAGMDYLGAYGNSHYYMKPDGDLTYWDAVDFVNSRGGHLPKVETQGENDWIAAQLSGSIWLSLSDEAQEGTWRWYDNEEAIYTNWKSGEPSNNSGEDFARMLPDGKWTDRPSSQYYWVIMEVECGSQGGGGIVDDVSYLWTPGNFTTPTITVSPTNTTTYTVQVTGCDGCVASDNVTVTVDGDFSCPADVTIDCDESAHPDNTGYPSLTCDPNAVITYEDNDSGTCPTIKTRTWTASVTRIVEDPCIPQDLAHWDFANAYAKCSNGVEPLDGNGLAPSSTTSSHCNNLYISNVTNNDGSSCVKGAFGSAESAICVTASPESFFKDNDDDAITFTVEFGANDEGRLTGISFYEKNQKHNENFGNVDYAQKYGFRVLKNGSEIYRNVDNPTTKDVWTLHNFDFTGVDFEYSGATIFKFEILGYDPTDFGYNKQVWEFDELIVRGCCGTEVSNEVQEFTCTQTITINDNEFPTLTNVPADVTVQCADDVPPVATDVIADDNCAFMTDFTEEVQNEQACNIFQVVRTWIVTDACGNETSDSQVITVEDTTPPTATNPTDITIDCYIDLPNPDTDVVVGEYDNCPEPPTVEWIDDDPDFVPCLDYETTIVRTYRVTDCSGNTTDVYQNIIIDNDGPSITCPADQTVECFSDITAGTPSVDGNCTPNPTVTTEGPYLVSGQDDCDGAKYEITYTVTDDCGNTDSCIQTFTIDNEGPTITCPADQTIECIDDINEGTPTVVTSCLLEYEVIVAIPTIIGTAANCPGNEYKILYSALDECNRSAECEQTFTIENDPPTITCPADEIVECYADISEGQATVQISCGIQYDVTTVGPTLVSGQADCDDAVYEIVYTVTDECGRSASCTQTFTLDNDGPTITCPADEIVECFDDIAEGTATVSVSCGLDYDVTTDGPNLVFGQDGCDDAVYEIVYTVTDECGRSASCTQTFTLDNEGPTIVCPDDLTVECIDDITEGIPTVTVACGLDYEVFVAMPSIVGAEANCPGQVYFISYTVEDECGRTATCDQKFTIENDPPTIVCPPDQVVECYDDIVAGTPSVTVSCFLDYDVTTDGPHLVFGQDGCDDAKYEITYTVTDVCGRSASCTQTFTLDNHGPTITCPADETVECYDDIASGTPVVIVACGLDYDVTTDGPHLVFGQDGCDDAVYEIVYTVEDECGRTSSCTQKFTLDNHGPTITCPADKTIECIDGIVEGIPTVSVACGLDYEVLVAIPDLMGPEINCPGNVYTITYTVVDECGREASCDQKFTIENDPPTIVCPPDQIVECYDDIVSGTPTVTVSCGLDYDVTTDGPYLVLGQDGCDEAKYELVYTVTDVCGRSASCTQTFTLDNDGPTITCPADETVECFDDIHIGTATVNVACGLDYDITTDGPHLVLGQDECDDAVYEVTYTVTDECGRTSSCIQKFTLDNEGPTIVCPPDQTIECISDMMEGIPTVTTSCGLDYQVFVAMPSIVGAEANCPGQVYYISYTVEDECGRTATCDQKFTIENDPPTIVCPPDQVVECYDDIVTGTPSVTVSCFLDYDVTTDGPHLVFGQDGCDDAKYEITYTVTDVCGRSASCTQTFTLDNHGPTITCPADETVECYDDIASGTPVVVVACGLDYDVTTDGPHLVFGQDGCDDAVYEIVYTVEDECGRTSSCTQKFTLDNHGPTITCPADKTIECIDGIVEGIPTVSVACGLDYEVFVAIPDLMGPEINCPGNVYTITYTVVDECGREASCDQKFTIENDPPTIVCPPDQIVECYDDIVSGTPTVTVSCFLDYDVTTDGPHLVFGQDGCDDAKYEITYTVTDVCGRSASCTQTFTLDNDGPTITCPADETVECYDDIHIGTPTVVVACGLHYDVTTDGPHLVFGQDNCDEAVYEVVYTVEDECGRTASCTQKFTLDNHGPTIVCPADKTIECIEGIVEGIPTVTVACGLEYEVFVAMPSIVGAEANCPGQVYYISYTVEDECGRTATCQQKFTIENDPPTIVCPPDLIVECYDDIVPGTPSVTVSCYLDYDVTTDGPHLVFGQDGCDDAKYEITYTVTDVCGRTASCTQTFTLDNHGPSITCPADETVECYDDIHIGTPTVVVACGLHYDVTTDGPHLVFGQDGCDDAVYEVVYTVEDECGRTASCAQRFTLDNHGPTIVCPADKTIECVDEIVEGIPTVTVACGLDYEVFVAIPDLMGPEINCPGNVYTITYTVVDECGREASCDQKFTIENDPPTIVCPPDQIVECYDDIVSGTPTVTVSCGLDYNVTTDGPHLVFGQDGCDDAKYEITYTVTDVCGRSASCTQTFTLDNHGPTITCPADETVECLEDIMAGTPTIVVACGLDYSLSATGPALQIGQENCPGEVYYITYVVEDECGRTATCQQKFTIDNVGPTITCPPDQIVECYDEIVPGTPVVTTSCDMPYTIATSGPHLVFGQDGCDDARYEIVYTVTDECGRSASCTQKWTLDNHGPTIVCPADEIVECYDDIYEGTPTVTVACGLDYDVVTEGPYLAFGQFGCDNAVYEIKYTVTDECGRSSFCIQKFTLENEGPTIVCPADQTIECVDDMMQGIPTVTVACGLDYEVFVAMPSISAFEANCPGKMYFISYTVEDECGRTASCTQKFTIDNVGPTIVCPPDQIVECYDEIVPGTPVVTTSCDMPYTITTSGPHLVFGQDGCDGARYEIVYTVEDECGRIDKCTQKWTLDNHGPEIVCPLDMTVECYDDITVGTPTVWVDCGLHYDLTTSGPHLVFGQDNCDDAVYEITYTATDECGRTASCTQKFTLDNHGPVITCPADETVECLEDIFAGTPHIEVACGVEYNISVVGPALQIGQENCPGEEYFIRYTVEDECGRVASCTQKFTIDNVGPTITCPPDQIVECYDEIVPGTPVVTTSCDMPYTITTSGPHLVFGQDGCDDARYEIVYTVTDECGRSASCTQKWTLDNFGPTIVCPADETVECLEDIYAGTPTVTVACGLDYDVVSEGPYLVFGQENCHQARYEIKYTVTDECGRSSFCIQKFTLDNHGPTIVCPADQTIECVDDMMQGIPTVTVACGLEYEVFVAMPTITPFEANCPGKIYFISYTVEDECGRTASCTQKFTIDNVGPTIVCPPDQIVECYDEIVPGTPVVTTSCGMPYTITTSGPHLVFGQDGCDGARYEIVYTVTDECGRIDKCTQKWTLNNHGPEIVCPFDMTVECYDDIVAGTPTVWVDCGLHYDLTTSGPHLVFGQDNCDDAVYEITYTATDECGRSASCTQKFTLDNHGPVITCPADETVECLEDIFAGTPHIEVACGLEYNISVVGPALQIGQENCPGEEYFIRYTVEDECGRVATCTQKFTIDNVGPTIVCPPDQIVECYDEIVPGTPVVTTSCDMPYTITTSGPHLVFGQDECDGARYEIVYTVTDECGRSASCTQKWTLNNFGPTISCPADEVVECYDDIHIGTPTVTVACGIDYDILTEGPYLVFGQDKCHGTRYEVKYTVTDECGRSSFCIQKFTLDNHGPTIVCPADQTIECVDDIMQGTPTVTVSCGLEYEVFVAMPSISAFEANCPGKVYIISYTVEDECGRTATCQQKFTIDNVGPTIVCPPDQVVECYDEIVPGTPVVTTSCGMPYTITTSGPHLVFGQDGCDGARYEIVYTVTDECGRIDKCTQKWTLNNHGPEIVCPFDMTVECYDDIVAGTPTVWVDCGLHYDLTTSGPHLVYGQDNCDDAVYEITYTATDECGRSASCTQKWTLDNHGPSITCPADETVECLEDIFAGTPHIDVACGLEYNISVVGPALQIGQENCPGEEYFIRYTVEDECGRVASCTQKFTIDNVGPTIACPPDQIVECYDEIVPGTPSVTTSCDMPYTITTSGPHLVFGQDECDGARYEIVYTVTDECGRSASCTQKWTLDNHGPTIVCPPDAVVECEDNIFPGTPVVNVSCGLHYDVTTSGPHLVFGQKDCYDAKYEIVYTITDECGRSASCTQTFTIENEGPWITCPPDAVVECYEDITVGTPSVTTSCGLGYTVTTSGPHLIFGRDNCDNARYELIYTVTDDCGRTNSCKQRFTIDNEGPTVVCPPDQIVDCFADIVPGTPTVYTSCGLTYTVSNSPAVLVSGEENCDGAQYEITYTVRDECGRTSYCVQKFTIDNHPPTIICPPDQVVECVDDIYTGIATVVASCELGYNVTTSGPYLIFGQTLCDGAQYEVIYTVTDDCGRSAQCAQKFTLENEGPTIYCPADKTIECVSEIVQGIPTVVTSCGVNYDVFVAMPTIVGPEANCPGKQYQIIYSVVDACGRTASCTQTFTIENHPPTIVCPADQDVECYEDIVIGIPTVNTSCNLPYTVTTSGPHLVFGSHDCYGAKYEVVYTATDVCGRSVSCTQTFTIDNDGPWITCPPDQVVECYDYITVGNPFVQTSCGLGYTVTTSGPTLVSGLNNCEGSKYAIVYTATDDCGRSASCTQTFTIDNDGPTITCPPNEVVDCASDIYPGTPVVYTSCGLTYQVTTSGPTLVSGIADCHGSVYQIVYTATDFCGRKSSCTQTFTIDNEGPTIYCPADKTVECYADIVAGFATVSSSCDLATTVRTSAPLLVSGQDNCHGAKYHITYTVTDVCGREASCTQTFTLDNHGPTIICPADAVVECKDYILPGTPTVYTSCGLDYNITTHGPTLVFGQEDCHGAKYELVYTVTDECGRSASCTQTFTIDNIGPRIVCPPDQTIQCISEMTPGTPIVTTSCGVDYDVVIAMPTVIGPDINCPGKQYQILYSVVDACGRSASCTQTFTIHNDGPTIVCPADKVVECYDDIIAGTPSVTTSCGLDYNLEIRGPELVSGIDNCHGAKYKITYIATDVCGRSASCVQIFTLSNNPPVITCPPNTVVECFHDIIPGTPTVYTSCGVGYTVTVNGPTLVSGQDDCNGAIYQVVYTAVDDCGRSSSCTQIWSIDNDGPTITCPLDVYVGRIEEFIPGNPDYHTSCGSIGTITTFGPVLVSGDDCANGVYQYTYTVTDECGRSKSCTQRIFIDPSDLSCHITGYGTTCGFDNGSATVSASGGYGPYTYAWSNGAFTQSVTGLAAGFYSVTVTDSEGCTSSCSVEIDDSTSPVCSVSGTDASCGDANGSATVTAILGTPPYSYAWSNGANTQTVTGLAAGTYTVVVTDALGCTTTCSVNIGDTVPPSCYATGTNTTCNENNGTATVFGIGGSGIYSYLWNTGQSTATVTGLAPGTYTVVVTDSNGCSTTCSVVINDSMAPRCNVSSTDTKCGANDGTAVVTPTGGTPPYLYQWSNGDNTAAISGLAAGTYTVVVTDAVGCQSMCSVTIKDSSSPVCYIDGTDTSCGLNNGSAEAVVSGGSGSYTYSWSNGATTNAINNLTPGTYSVTVTDSNGCYTTCSVFIQGSAPISCTVSGYDTTCELNNGSATVSVTGGSGSYSYAWSNGSASQTVSGLSPGFYTVNVIDNVTGCATSCSVTINGSSPISCYIDGYDTTCGFNNGSATVNVSGGSGSYSYAWNTGSSAQSISGLSAGTYTVNVVDNVTGCTTSCTVFIQGSAPLACTVNGYDTTCGSSNGSATVNVTNGSGNYSYSWSNGSSSQSINGLSAGSYTVNVIDNVTGCTTSCSVTISQSNPISCTITGQPTTCGFRNGSATVTVNGGSGNYSYNWNNGGTTQTVTGLDAGSYSVVVTDINTGCTSTCSVIIQGSQPIVCSATGTDPSCGLSNGSVTVNVTNGSGNYSYNWSNGATTQTVTNLPEGTYVVNVVDLSTGCTNVCSVTLQASSSLTCYASGNDPTCGLSNGNVTVNASGGSGSYTYTWNIGSTSQTVTGLSGGTYVVEVTDTFTGCTTTCSVTLQSSTPITCSVVGTNPTCGEHNGSAFVNVNGGSGNYSYNWNTGANTQSISGLAAGTYIVDVVDLNSGCTTSCSVVIAGSTPIYCIAESTDANCGLNNGSASVSVSGGTGAYSYSWNNGGTTQTISNLAAGTYSVTVVDVNSGCTTSCSVTVNGTNPISCTTTSTNTDCGIANGTATVSVSGGSGNYSYAWSNGGSGSTITGLTEGTYSVIVTDNSTGCITSCTAVVSGSTPITCSATSVNTSCGLSNGSASVSISGGSGNYSYSWSNGGTFPTITGLAAGTYFVDVVDTNTGCSTSCSVVVAGSTAPVCSVSGTDASCGLSNGTASVSVVGGQVPYSYSWSNGASTANLSNLTAGTYSVTVTDAAGCTTSCSVVIGSGSSVSCTVSSTDVTCDDSNGTATVVASGGSGVYTYLWSNGGTTATITGLDTGVYTVTVTDSNGCSTTCTIIVSGMGIPICTTISTPESCDMANGTATVAATGGAGNYTYLWSNGGTLPTITNLTAGIYTVTVTDMMGCSTVRTVEVEDGGKPSCIITNQNAACGGATGSATVIATGGAGGYTYQWSNGATTATINNVPSGTYSVVVTDAAGCTTVCSTVIALEPSPECSITSTDASCGQANGTATVFATGGIPGYTYLWSTGATTSSITGLTSGVYNVTVSDSNGCTTTCTAVIGSGSSLSCSVVTSDTSCGLANGTATATVSGGTAGYSYQWSNGGTTATIIGLVEGTYTVTITDATGCTTVCSGTVGTSQGGPQCVVSGTDSSCSDPNGTAWVSASGGTAPYTYLWSNGATSQSIDGLIAGEYFVTVTDANGCASVCSITIESIGGPTCSVTAFDAQCGASNGALTASAFGGSGLYSFQWSNGATSPTIFGLAAGYYSVTITDQKGCQVVCSAEVGNDDSDCTAEVGDFVWEDLNADGIQDENEPGIPGVKVTLWNAISGDVVGMDTTDVNGLYHFTGLAEGSYYCEFGALPVTYVNYVVSPHVQPNTQQAVNSDITDANGPRTTDMFYLVSGEANHDIDAGFYRGATIGNQVWCDNPEGGLPNLFDSGDSPVEGAIISLYSYNILSGQETLVGVDTTDANGNYLFTGLPQGTYLIEADVTLLGKVFVSANAQDINGNQPDEIDSDIIYRILEEQQPTGETRSVGRTNLISLSTGEVNLTIDVGLGEGTVPIELYDFVGRWNDQKEVSELEWVTDVEVNSYYFAVERTNDLSSEFEEIGRVQAAGNSSVTNYYDYEDDTIFESGEYYYRLRMVDLDGSYSYSKVIVVEVDMELREQEIGLLVYPNPVIDEITVEMSVERRSQFEGGIYDAIGKLIQDIDIQTLDAGKTNLRVDVSNLPVGTYLLRIKIDNDVIFERITKTQ